MNEKSIHRVPQGIHIDQPTGCWHYSSPLDIVAILFKCCRRHYACYFCHEALADHPAERWQPHEYDTQAILCCACNNTMTIHQYQSCAMRCIHCSAAFNPGCKTHWHLYF